MPKILILSCLALALGTGCAFVKKSGKPKDDGRIATENEEAFRKRWVDKRAAELVAKGTAADAARTQAEAEFREHYDFSRTPPK